MAALPGGSASYDTEVSPAALLKSRHSMGSPMNRSPLSSPNRRSRPALPISTSSPSPPRITSRSGQIDLLVRLAFFRGQDMDRERQGLARRARRRIDLQVVRPGRLALQTDHRLAPRDDASRGVVQIADDTRCRGSDVQAGRVAGTPVEIDGPVVVGTGIARDDERRPRVACREERFYGVPGDLGPQHVILNRSDVMPGCELASYPNPVR